MLNARLLRPPNTNRNGKAEEDRYRYIKAPFSGFSSWS